MCCAYSLSPVQLFATPQTVALQAPLSMGILQAKILEWVTMPFSRGSSRPRDRTQDPGIELEFLMSPALAGRFFTTNATWEAHKHVYLHTYVMYI